MNVMTHELEKRSPLLPLGIDVQSTYATLSTGSNQVVVVLRNNTRDWIEIGNGMPVGRMVATNQVPHVVDTIYTLETALCYQHYFCNTELRNCNNNN